MVKMGLAANMLLLLLLPPMADAAVSRCSDRVNVDPADKELTLFYTCTCAEELCNNLWESRNKVYPRKFGQVPAFKKCRLCRDTCKNVQRGISNTNSRRRRALDASNRCSDKLKDAWKDLGSPSLFSPQRANSPSLPPGYDPSVKYRYNKSDNCLEIV